MTKYLSPRDTLLANLSHLSFMGDETGDNVKIDNQHFATVPYNVLMQMIRHPLTDIGISRFLSDWQRVSQR